MKKCGRVGVSKGWRAGKEWGLGREAQRTPPREWVTYVGETKSIMALSAIRVDMAKDVEGRSVVDALNRLRGEGGASVLRTERSPAAAG